MLSFLGSIVVLLVIFYIGYYAYCKSVKSKVATKLCESDLVKKFNRAVKKLTSRNLDSVKEELLEILEEYRHVKCESFIESKTLLNNSLDSLKVQMSRIKDQDSIFVSKIKEIKSKKNLTSEDEKIGAMYVSELEKLRAVYSNIEKSKAKVEDNIRIVNSSINMFNHKYELKKSEIVVMIANAATVKNVTSIDIKLSDLVTEFNTKVRESEIRTEVTDKIYNVNADKEMPHNYNEVEYIEKFKNFSE